MNPPLVDFHTHLDLFPNMEETLKAAELSKIFTLTVTTTPRAWPRNRSLTNGMEFVHPALGLHPQLVGERANELSIWETHLPETRFIGEVGLDGSSQFAASLDKQRMVFERILSACADLRDRILTVHSLRATSMVLDMIETYLPQERGQIVLHWFTGSLREAIRGVDLGCYFSINQKMARTKNGQVLISNVPKERLLTETDSPFVQAPTDKPNTKILINEAVERIGSILGLNFNRSSILIYDNLKRLLNT